MPKKTGNTRERKKKRKYQGKNKFGKYNSKSVRIKEKQMKGRQGR